MPNNVEKMTLNYSPNFELPKRSKKRIKYLIFHYTGMKNDFLAIKKLTSEKSKVSCHYFINKKGELIQIVPDLYIAWHAGKSRWKKDNLLNKNSIGIEISNPGHEHGYKKFSKKQVSTLIKISIKLMKKYKISKKNILGHSDIAPLRKKDPGEKFPWKYLSTKNIGFWHKINPKNLKKIRGIDIDFKMNIFIKKLKKFGYYTEYSNSNNLKKLIKSFQRRFRPELVNGKLDKECLEIIKSLI